MRLSHHSTITAACLTLASNVSCYTGLQHWPNEAAAALDELIINNANKSNYAVFDMDVSKTRI